MRSSSFEIFSSDDDDDGDMLIKPDTLETKEAKFPYPTKPQTAQELLKLASARATGSSSTRAVDPTPEEPPPEEKAAPATTETQGKKSQAGSLPGA